MIVIFAASRAYDEARDERVLSAKVRTVRDSIPPTSGITLFK